MTTVENEAQKLLSQNPQDNQKFGKSVSISGNYAIVGTVDSTVKSNQAYIYELSNGTWEAKQYLIQLFIVILIKLGTCINEW